MQQPLRRVRLATCWRFRAMVVVVAALASLERAEANLLAIDVQRPDTVYVGTDRGVFKSTDGGDSWVARNVGLPVRPQLSITVLAIDPVNPATLYAGTNGLFKSIDGGMSWTSSHSGLTSRPFPDLPASVTALAIDPRAPTTLYAGAGLGTDSSGEKFGRVFKSTDGGATWRLSSTGLADMGISALVIDPHAPGTVFAVTSMSGVFKTMDGGATWRPSGAGLPAGRITALAVDSRQPATLYAGTSRSGLFKSADGGVSWRPSNAGLADVGISLLAVHGRTQTTLYVATVRCSAPPSPPPGRGPRMPEVCPSNGLFKSVDGGATWRRSGDVDLSIAALAIDPRVPSTLYAAGSTSVFKSKNGGTTWLRSNAGPRDLGAVLNRLNVMTLAIDPVQPATLYVSLVDEEALPSGLGGRGPGVFKSTDGGAHWRRSDAGLDQLVTVFALDPRAPDTLYAGTVRGQVFKSIDGGARWKASGAGLPLDSIGALAIARGDSRTVYAGMLNNGVFRSTNGGVNWTASNAGLSGSRSVTDLLAHPHIAGTLYVTMHALGSPSPTPGRVEGIFKSVDGGLNWSPLAGLVRAGARGLRNLGLPLSFQGLALTPGPRVTMYAGITLEGVFASTDDGASWLARNDGLIDLSVMGVNVDSRNPSTIYAHTVGGLFKSTDGGGRWTPAMVGLPEPPALTVRALVIDPSSPATVYVGTATHGVFKSTDGGLSWQLSNTGLLPKK